MKHWVVLLEGSGERDEGDHGLGGLLFGLLPSVDGEGGEVGEALLYRAVLLLDAKLPHPHTIVSLAQCLVQQLQQSNLKILLPPSLPPSLPL